MSTDKKRNSEIELKEGYMKKRDHETRFFTVTHGVRHKIVESWNLVENLQSQKQNIEFRR